MQIGMSGLYLRAQYSHIDNSVDFSIADYKGTIKLCHFNGTYLSISTYQSYQSIKLFNFVVPYLYTLVCGYYDCR